MPLLTTVPRAGLVRIEYVRESSESMSDPLNARVIELASSIVVEVIDVTVGALFILLTVTTKLCDIEVKDGSVAMIFIL